ncbi:glycosyltransferase [Peribacillus frigoritolerans]|uniref:glycosyltransferase n=1 Tax=Peribacillus frigoritolerans TaxID=450367 RepID=UPI0021D39601|nr:glycosyltransferase [Peribacillus frigoritolerans]MCU6600457.1 glycosyltransferase [Peribacillus frigoritolerans]
MIRIIYLVSTLKRTGPTNQLLNIVSNIDTQKYKPLIVTISPEPADSMFSYFREKNIEIKSLNLSRKMFPFALREIKKILKDFKPDIIHSSGERADILAHLCTRKKSSIKHISTLRNYPYEDLIALYGEKVKIFCKVYIKIIKKIPFIITCSKSLGRIYMLNENLKTYSIQNSVNTKKFDIADFEKRKVLRESLGFEANDFIFISTGGLLLRKDPKTTIEGFLNVYSNQANKKLLILGDGNLLSIKEDYKSNSNVIFTGKVSNVDEYLGISDVFISSSLSEGLPNAVLEAMSTGLPCILSDIPQHREAVDNQEYALFHILQDSSDLTKRLLDIENMKFDKYKLRKYVLDNFSSENMSIKYQNFYKKVMV